MFLRILNKNSNMTKKEGKIVFAVFIILLIIVAALIIFSPAGCATESCFVNKASKCLSATYTNKINDITIYYETNNCILKKTVKDIPVGEPEQIREKFLNREMYCQYAKGDFSVLYIRTLSGLLNTCEGPLKDGISSYSFSAFR